MIFTVSVAVSINDDSVVLCQYCCAEIPFIFCGALLHVSDFFDPTGQREIAGMVCGLLSSFPWGGGHGDSNIEKGMPEISHLAETHHKPLLALKLSSTLLSCHPVSLEADHTQGPTRPAASPNSF